MRFQAPHPLLLADAALRLGVRPLVRYALHRATRALGATRRSLPDLPSSAWPISGPFLPSLAVTAPCVPPQHSLALRSAAAALPPASEHGSFDPGAHALALDLFSPGDVRPVWEANRLADLPLLVQAHRLAPTDGYDELIERRLRAWMVANPPFRGANWACGQEAALRVLHLALAQGLSGGGRASPALRGLMEVHARRIAVTRSYAAAQDNNHSVSEPAGSFVCALLLGEDPRQHAVDLSAAVARLITADGAFAQVSTGYHRLLLDVLATTEWLRRNHAAPPFPEPFGSRAAAATLWLARMIDPDSGAMPKLGHQDGSRFADLSLAGEDDARGSLERAARIFLGVSAGMPDDPGCTWLTLAVGGGLPPPLPEWRASGTRGWMQGSVRVLLRTGPLCFRPGQSDLLNLDLWDGSANVLRDGGTLSYNPGPRLREAAEQLADARAHNAAVFDSTEPMPRVGRFLRARWLTTGDLPNGAWTRDADGNRHEREVCLADRALLVRDRVSGHFQEVTFRWRLPPACWRQTSNGAVSKRASLTIEADAPFTASLEPGLEAECYGRLREVPVLRVQAFRPVTSINTRVQLPSTF